MKQVLILLVVLSSLASCSNIRGNRDAVKEMRAEIEHKNAVYTAKNDSFDAVINRKEIIVDSMSRVRDSLFFAYKRSVERLGVENKVLQRRVDSMQVASDTLAARLLHARLIIENARYYLRIANRNQSQQKFLRGWMNRALEVH